MAHQGGRHERLRLVVSGSHVSLLRLRSGLVLWRGEGCDDVAEGAHTMTPPKENGMNIYVASSWRNTKQPSVVECLRVAGHEVYDFRNPSESDCGFAWSEIDPEWQTWGAKEFRANLDHPMSEAGFKSDMIALEWADAVVLVLPCGRSAHLELGWACGSGKRTAILLTGTDEPELMYKMVDLVSDSLQEIVEWLAQP